MFGWLKRRRRKRILETPFPDGWRGYLERNMAHFAYLSADEARRLCERVQIFVAEKSWFGAGGLELTDEMRVTIAGQACLLLLELDVEYTNVESIVIYPGAVRRVHRDEPFFATPHVVEEGAPLLGETLEGGPLVLTWRAVRHGGRHPGRAPNVVYHEFAHQLDLLDGAVDGVPLITNRAQYRRWVEVCTREFEGLRAAVDSGKDPLLDPYGLTDVGEFFAVVTEAFFDEPIDLEHEHPELYAVLRSFYRQDPAARQRRHEAVHTPGRPGG